MKCRSSLRDLEAEKQKLCSHIAPHTLTLTPVQGVKPYEKRSHSITKWRVRPCACSLC